MFGGPQITDRNAHELLSSFEWLDATIPAPAYVPLAALVTDPAQARTRPLPPGSWRRSASGEIESNPVPAWIDLDTLPAADWSGVDLRRYVPGFLLVDTPEGMALWYPTIPLHSSQGCSYNACGFCYNVALYPRFAVQSPAHVIDDLRHHVDVVGSRGFFFTDFEFNSQPHRVLEICRRVQDLPYEIRFYSWLRLDKIGRSLLDAMYAAGARQVFIGVEAIDDDLLRLMRKGYTAKFALAQLELLTRFSTEYPDFRFEFNLITSYPGETLASVRNTLAQLAQRPHLFYHRVAAVVEFMLHEGTHAFHELRAIAVGCNEPLLPPGARVRSYRHVYAAPHDPTAAARREIWSAIRAFAQAHA